MKQFIEHLTGRVVLMKNEHDQSWDFPHTHSIHLPAQESHKHETTKLLNFTISSTRSLAPASANAPGHGSLRALSLGKCVRRCCLGEPLALPTLPALGAASRCTRSGAGCCQPPACMPLPRVQHALPGKQRSSCWPAGSP